MMAGYGATGLETGPQLGAEAWRTYALAVNSADTSRGNADGGVRLGARDVPICVNVELLVGVAVNVSRINLDGADRTCRVWRP